jgi:hypothetical protein
LSASQPSQVVTEKFQNDSRKLIQFPDKEEGNGCRNVGLFAVEHRDTAETVLLLASAVKVSDYRFFSC